MHTSATSATPGDSAPVPKPLSCIDVNCDLGEWRAGPPDLEPGRSDAAIMPYISSVNIACGLHAGDPASIERSVLLALRHGVGIGAHPGYPDPEGFGRKPVVMRAEELRASLLYQAGAVKVITESLGGRLRHVKPHGALYNAAARDSGLAKLIASAVKAIDPGLILIGLSGSAMERAALNAGLLFASEVFADRSYRDDGSLVARDEPGSILSDTDQMVERAIMMIAGGIVVSVSGKRIPVKPDTLCIHGDNPCVHDFLRRLSARLREAGIAVKSLGTA